MDPIDIPPIKFYDMGPSKFQESVDMLLCVLGGKNLWNKNTISDTISVYSFPNSEMIIVRIPYISKGMNTINDNFIKKYSTGKATGEVSLIGFKKDPFYAKVRYALSELPREGYY